MRRRSRCPDRHGRLAEGPSRPSPPGGRRGSSLPERKARLAAGVAPGQHSLTAPVAGREPRAGSPAAGRLLPAPRPAEAPRGRPPPPSPRLLRLSPAPRPLPPCGSGCSSACSCCRKRCHTVSRHPRPPLCGSPRAFLTAGPPPSPSGGPLLPPAPAVAPAAAPGQGQEPSLGQWWRGCRPAGQRRGEGGWSLGVRPALASAEAVRRRPKTRSPCGGFEEG